MDQALKLSEFLDQIQEHLRDGFPDTYSVVAEIASLSGSKHLYFELIEKDGNQINAKTRANLWAFNRYRVVGHFENITRERLKPGMKVLFRVQAEFHSQYGFSLTIVDIDPSYSLGEFERIKLETIKKLQEDGLLEINKSLGLPIIFKRLAIITSATAAGYQDFMQHLNENGFGYAFETTLFSCLVQGEKAPESIIVALNTMEKDKKGFDAVVLIRGGGSVIDLSCFDDYALNFTLAQSSYPVLTGIGHDRDQSVADLVAHTFLKTPTAVAEYIISHNALFEEALQNMAFEIGQLVQQKLKAAKDQIAQNAQNIKTVVQELIFEKTLEGNHLKNEIKAQLINQLYSQQNMLKKQQSRLQLQMKMLLKAQEAKLSLQEQQLEYLKPEKMFKRGYTLSLVNGQTLNDSYLKLGDTLETYGHEIHIKSTIKSIE